MASYLPDTSSVTQVVETVIQYLPDLPSPPELSYDNLCSVVEEAWLLFSNINIYWTNIVEGTVTLLPETIEPIYFFAAGKLKMK